MTFEPSELIVRRMTFSRDGSHFLTSRYDGKVRIRETKTGRLVARLASGSQCADISADNRLVATSGWGATAYVYRVQLRAATRDEQGQIAALLSRFADDSYAVRMSALAEIEKFAAELRHSAERATR